MYFVLKTVKEHSLTNYLTFMSFTNQYLIDYFKQRMVELYDHNTLDSYSVRTCNSMSMFYEVREMLDGWIACNVKRGDTVSRCIEECIEKLLNDKWLDFSFYDKKKLIDSLEGYRKKVANIKDSREKKEQENNEARFILHLVSSCITANETNYLSTLIDSIREDLLTESTYQDILFLSVIKDLDGKLSLMATELVRRGYSRSFLYFFFKSIKKNKEGISFSEAFNQLQLKFDAVQQYHDIVIIRMDFLHDSVPAMANMVDEIPSEYMEVMQGSLKGILKKAPGRRFYIVKENAADTSSALQNARLRLSQALDRNDMGVVRISNNGAVSYTKEGSLAFRSERYYKIGNRRNGLNQLPEIMHTIDNTRAISHDIKDRLNTALRHLRVGDDQTEIEQRFLNYWIGLEFIFSTPRSGDSTFARMIDKFPIIMALYYLKRNVLNLDFRLREKGLIRENDSFGLFTETQMDSIYNNTSDVLLKYRIKSMKSHLHDHEKVKNYLARHIKNLQWHLSRIYYYRNELVHEAAIKQSIESVAENLRSYLVSMLNLLLNYCQLQLTSPHSIPVTMDNFFWHYELLWKKCTPEFNKDEFMSLDMPANLVR